MTVVPIILALLALSFLIFIHELGHYFMARRVGMRVEVFSIGFGRPIYSWTWQEARWQVCWLLFGGYVKIAGTETEGQVDPYKVKDGFFGKSPWARIQVAFMGPFVNILFALLAFALLWVNGGRERAFSEQTAKVGWVDPHSALYAAGLRPGDEIRAYGTNSYQGVQDHTLAALTAQGVVKVDAVKVDYATGGKSAFVIEAKAYPYPGQSDESLRTLGVLQPASYLFYNLLPGGKPNPLPEGSPMGAAGLHYGDRLLWIDGHRIFSLQQLSQLLNDDRVLVVVERQGQKLLMRVPRIPFEELRLDPLFRDEVADWRFEAQLTQVKLPKLFLLPYNLTHDAVVERPLRFLDQEREKQFFSDPVLSALELPLQPGDKIVSVAGIPIKTSADLLNQIQEKTVRVIVARMEHPLPVTSSREADRLFDKMTYGVTLEQIERQLADATGGVVEGELVLLAPIHPKQQKQFLGADLLQAQRQKMESVDNPQQRAQMLKLFDKKAQQWALGVPQVQDLRVQYNIIPTEQFWLVLREIGKTLGALFTGALEPKWMSGPVGIVYALQERGQASINDGLYWLGMISLNLGVLNLLPIPLLDGGTIVLSFFEWATKKKIRPKTLENIILPFAILLIAMFLFLTYNDISRIFTSFFR